MCTVSIISLSNGFRLVCNRDEARDRPLARPPEIVDNHAVRAVMPIDTESGGTWIAGTENQLAFALLNLNLSATGSADGRSRGEIIPQLLMCRTVDEVAAKMLNLPDGPYRPFRLVVAGSDAVMEICQSPPHALRHSLAAPLMFTSSGLGDHLVEAPRRELFERIMAGPGSLVEKQNRFHAHRWPSRPHISVNMKRAEASTVSRTVLEVEGNRVHMEYTAVGHKESVRTVEFYRSQSNK